MYAIAFDLESAKLKEHYGEPYNNAYLEIGKELKDLGFDWIQGRRIGAILLGLLKIKLAVINCKNPTSF